MASEPLMPGPEGKIPRLYEVEKGHKTESYIVAISGRKEKPVAPAARPAPLPEEPLPVAYKKEVDTVIVRPPPATVGLTREQLEQYRDDPFWKPLRWILFILFWALWIAMFLIAILIVVLSPSCAPKAVQKWYQTKVCYQAWTPSLQDSDGDGMGDLKGAASRLEQLRKIGVQSFWPTPILDSDAFSYAVVDHRAVDKKLGTPEDFAELIDTLHDKSMYMIMDMPVSTTSKEHHWFKSSSQATDPAHSNFSDYYFWRPTAPNKEFWSPLEGGVEDNFFYMHYENKPQWPILNWNSQALRMEMFDIITHWLEKGVDGFFISYVEYLVRTNDGTKPDWSRIYEVLSDMRHHVDTRKNETENIKDKSILLFTSLHESKEKDKLALVNAGLNTVINYELGKVQLGTSVCPNGESTVTKCVNEILADVLAVHNLNENFLPMWEFGNPYVSRLASRVQSRPQAEALTMLQLLLPGSNNFYYGEEIGMRDLPVGENAQRGAMLWSDGENAGFSTSSHLNVTVHDDYKNINFEKQYGEEISPVKMFKKLAKLRQRDETLMLGKSIVGKPVGQAFTFSRYRRESNVTIGKLYVGAINLGQEATSLSLSDIPALTSDKLPKAELVAMTTNVHGYKIRDKYDLSSGILNVGAEQGFVFRF